MGTKVRASWFGSGHRRRSIYSGVPNNAVIICRMRTAVLRVSHLATMVVGHFLRCCSWLGCEGKTGAEDWLPPVIRYSLGQTSGKCMQGGSVCAFVVSGVFCHNQLQIGRKTKQSKSNESTHPRRIQQGRFRWSDSIRVGYIPRQRLCFSVSSTLNNDLEEEKEKELETPRAAVKKMQKYRLDDRKEEPRLSLFTDTTSIFDSVGSEEPQRHKMQERISNRRDRDTVRLDDVLSRRRQDSKRNLFQDTASIIGSAASEEPQRHKLQDRLITRSERRGRSSLPMSGESRRSNRRSATGRGTVSEQRNRSASLRSNSLPKHCGSQGW